MPAKADAAPGRAAEPGAEADPPLAAAVEWAANGDVTCGNAAADAPDGVAVDCRAPSQWRLGLITEPAATPAAALGLADAAAAARLLALA
jgi:hypothetical protein